MASYPPSGSAPLPGEEYELGTAQLHRTTSRARTLTIHPNASTILFTAPGTSAGPQQRRSRRRSSLPSNAPSSPRETTGRFNRAFFLNEDGGQTETVQVPDIGHMLGFETGEDHYEIASGLHSRWRRKLYLLMEEPSSGREAFFIHVAVTGAILFSAMLTTLSTLPAFHTDAVAVKVLFGFDTMIVLLFTVEYLARSVAHSNSWKMYYTWATSFFAVLDLISILPYYIEIAQQADTSIMFRFSILRTFRLLRVFRAFRYQNQMLLTIEVMYVAVRRSKDALIAISYFILLVLVLFSTLIYFAERGTWDSTLGAFVDPDGDVSLFDSIPQTAWYALVTMSTAGYGDVVPKTALGKILSVPLLLFGLLLIALPSFVLGRNFAIVYDAMIGAAHNAPATPRDSVEEDRGLATVSEESDIPLLPTTAANGGNRTRSTSPSELEHPRPRMWTGDPNKHTPGPFAAAPGQTAANLRDKDLTNVKLAKNQYVLLEQIDSLRNTVDRQSEMLEVLMRALGENQIPKVDKGKGCEEFDLGDSTDDDK